MAHYHLDLPLIDVKRDFGASGSGQSTTATCTSGSTVITLSSALDFQDMQGVNLANAGPAISLATPTAGPTVVATGTAGATTYAYSISYLDGAGGQTAAVEASIANGNATLSSSNYNALSWSSPPSGTQAVAIYRVAAGGTSPTSTGLVALLDPSTTSVNDTGFGLVTAPVGVSVSSPSSSTNDFLRTSILSGGGTTNLTLADAPSLSGSTSIHHDDTQAITNALNSGASQVYLPEGTYPITSSLPVPSNMTIQGAGRYTSKIYPLCAGLYSFSQGYSSTTEVKSTIRCIGFYSRQVNTGAISLTECSNILLDSLYAQGIQNYLTIDRGWGFQVGNLETDGSPYINDATARIWFGSTSETDYGYDLRLSGLYMRNIGNGMASPAVTLHRAVGTLITNIDVNQLSSLYGLPVIGVLVEDDCQGVKISDSTLVYPSQFGIQFVNGSTGVAPTFCTVNNVDIDQCQGNAIQINNGQWITISGCNFTATAQNAVLLNDDKNKVFGCVIHQDSNNGVNVGTGVSEVDVSHNYFGGTMSAGILINSGSGNNFIVTENTFSSSVSTPIINEATGTDIVLEKNIGAKPLSPASVSGTTAGTIYWWQEHQGTVKKVVVYLDGYENDTATAQTITFPMAFTYTPLVNNQSGAPGVSATTTELSIDPNAAMAYTGYIEVTGF